MAKNARFKPPKTKKGLRITAQEPPNYEEMPPVFSLQRIPNTKYCLSALDRDNKAAFADSIYKRRTITWKEIKQLHRHKLGFEKISRDSVKLNMPNSVTDDVNDFIAFRYNGMAPMVGYRQKDVFYVLWFDHDFTLYEH